MQFTWNIAQGVSSYNKQTGFGFVIGAVYNANAALRIPETNSSFCRSGVSRVPQFVM